ncbi:DUF4870 domain-containing protein [Empedobacter brevis]|uniref:DUF4870 domain-containing protein n=1 Tax=Empedobacter brevis TaxID=247 RepID=UPI002898DA5A|nr:DUF4870 domain-containing protein [Empedobacter brevis]
MMLPKVQSILSYVGILWLVAFFAGKEERNDLSRYHLKQGLGLWIIAILFNIAAYIVIIIAPDIALIPGFIIILFLILMVFGIINAANEVKKPVPLVGRLFENKFPFIDR